MSKPLVFILAFCCLVQSLFAQELIPYRKGKLSGFDDSLRKGHLADSGLAPDASPNAANVKVLRRQTWSENIFCKKNNVPLLIHQLKLFMQVRKLPLVRMELWPHVSGRLLVNSTVVPWCQ